MSGAIAGDRRKGGHPRGEYADIDVANHEQQSQQHNAEEDDDLHSRRTLHSRVEAS